MNLTGNAVPSTNPKDFEDNAHTLDHFVNGAANLTPTRTGRQIKTLQGMQAQFDAIIAGMDAVDLGAYASGKVLQGYRYFFTKDGVKYSPKASTTLPYTLTGTWATDSAKVQVFVDTSLRSDLLASGGAGHVGFRFAPTAQAQTVEDYLKTCGQVNIKSFGAVGDGVADDTAAINAAHAVASASGQTLLFPAGGVFKYNGSLALHVPLLGTGAVMLTARTTAQTAVTSGLINISGPNAAIVGLTLELGGMQLGVRVNSVNPLVLRDARIQNPAVSGVWGALSAQVSIDGLVVTNATTIGTPDAAAGGVHVQNCATVSMQNVAVYGYDGSAIRVRQSSSSYPCKAHLNNIQISGGVDATGRTLTHSGINLINILAAQVSTVVVNSPIDAASPNGLRAAGIRISNNTNQQSVYMLDGIQINGQSASGYCGSGILIDGENKVGHIVIDGVDASMCHTAVSLLGGAESLVAKSVYGRDLRYDSAEFERSGVVYVRADDVDEFGSVSLEGLRNINPHIATTARSSVYVSGVKDLQLAHISDSVSISLQAANTYINGCSRLGVKSMSLAYGKFTAVNSRFVGESGYLSSLCSRGSELHMVGCRIENFLSFGGQPSVFMVAGCGIQDSVLPMAQIMTTINGNTILHTSAGGPFRTGPITSDAALQINISANNVIMLDPSAYLCGKGTGLSVSPEAFTITGNIWSGGQAEITNWTGNSVVANNLRAGN